MNSTSSVHEEEPAPEKHSALKRYYNYTRHTWLVAIGIGLLAQTFRSSDTTPREGQILDNIELGVTIVLLVEIFLRFASDWRKFHIKKRNWVDFTMALITVIMQSPMVKNSGRMYEWLTIFQILRIYRVVWAIPVTRNLLVRDLFYPVSGVFLIVRRLKSWVTYPVWRICCSLSSCLPSCALSSPFNSSVETYRRTTKMKPHRFRFTPSSTPSWGCTRSSPVKTGRRSCT